MTDYIKIPTRPPQDRFRGVEAVSASPRINPKPPRPEGYAQQAIDPATKRKGRAPRRFLALRRLIQKLQESAQIIKVDFTTAEAELQRLGLALIDDGLLMQQQIDRNHARVSLSRGPRISHTEPSLFPVSTLGLSEYNLKIEELRISPGKTEHKIVELVDREGLCIEQRNRLRLTYSRVDPALGTVNDLLNLKISVLLGVMESDDEDRRAILYPRADKSYGLYADKLINLSI